MKRIVIRGVVTFCAALLVAGTCHIVGADDEREVRHTRRETEQRRRELEREADQLRREIEHEQWLRKREALGERREEEREAFLERREREREEFLEWQERQREQRSARDSDGRFDDADFRPRPGDGPNWDAQRVSEARKLQHQLDQAERLRRISEQNGNPRLAEVAERMEERALAHYERRLAHIDQLQDAGQDVFSTPIAEPPGRRLSEFSDDYQRRLFNEEQTLRQRLAAADRMRQLGEYYRDPQLIDEAARIEEAALTNFDQQMQQFRAPLTPVQQVQLDQYLQESIAGALEYELDRRVVQPIHETLIQPIDDLEHAILDQPVRYLIEDVSDWISR
jgi:hypothetical protein